MLGAIIGDMAGSIYEHHNLKSKVFPFYGPRSSPTDDSIMTLAVAKAILEADGDYDELEKLQSSNIFLTSNIASVSANSEDEFDEYIINYKLFNLFFNHFY